jgi:hypothetical protein
MAKTARRKIIDKLKKEYKEYIQQVAENNQGGRDSYVPYFCNGEYINARCYGHLFGEFSRREVKDVQFTLKFDNENGWFDFTALFKEMNSMFKTYFKILRYLSGFKVVRIIDFESKKRVNWKWRFIAMYVCFTMLRVININNWPRWRIYFKKYPELMPIKKWEDIVFIFFKHFSESKYSLNDDLKSHWMSVVEGRLTEEQFREKIRTDSLDVIKWAFGSKYQFTRADLGGIGEFLGTQTPVVETLRRLKRSKKA